MAIPVLCFSIVFCLSLFSSTSFGFGPSVKLVLRSENHHPRRFAHNDAGPMDQLGKTVDSDKQSQGPGYFIPTDQIDKLKQSVDLVSVIESYNLPKFRSNGDRATCICPFHDDNNPSLSIDGTRGIYKCFSCGAGGNVYNFVREYSKLEGEEMSFYRAVKLVNDRYANGFSLNLADTSFRKSTKSMEAYKIQEAKKQRIFLANFAAAGFFEESLVSLREAGAARSHLRARGMNPNTVRAFAVGFAPDCYFQRKSYGPKGWGEGSLVNYLKHMNFTAQEIFDAGLATRTKAKTKQQTTLSDSSSNKTDSEIYYSNLMDRFRGRIVIPIFDATGKNVLGFGGRILKNDEGNSEFKAAKYLNSPESLVFKKQNILYGQHMAKKSLRYWADQGNDASRPVVIVEGYMDAIALWQAGIREAVASMGTALTSNQLEAAAAIAGTRNGRIVICLDNDAAGLNAIERLCTGNILSSITERFPLEILIASLPKDVKDPADYIELIKDSNNPEEKFRTDVVGGALEWSDWYIKHLLSSYDSQSPRGSHASFGDIFERLAGFLATYMNAAERTKRACEVAAYLADILSDDGNTTQISNAVRVQLETDLVEKAASIANSNAAISNRIAPSGARDGDVQTKLYNVARGDGSFGIDEADKLSTKALRRISKPSRDKTKSTGPIPQQADGRRPLQGSRLPMSRPPLNQEPTLTPHFSGFEFLSENDAKWLGLMDAKGKQKNDRLIPKSAVNEFGEINGLKQKKAVYFNSNEYHGNQFLTQEAIMAGYKDEAIKRDSRVFENGITSLLQLNENDASVSAEDSLLRMLLLFSSARKSLKTGIGISYASGSDETIEWSSSSREWLFSCLVEQEADIPPGIVGPADVEMLREYLATRPDAFPGAFGSVSEESEDATDGIIVAATTSDMEGTSGEKITVGRDNRGLEVSTSKVESSSMTDSTEPTLLSESSATDTEKNLAESTAKPSTQGEFDLLFDNPLDLLGNMSLSGDAEEKFQLSAQQVYSTLLWTSARKRLSRIQHHLMTAVGLLQKSREGEEEDAPQNEIERLLPEGKESNTSSSLQFFNKTVTRQELKDFCTSLTIAIQDSAQKVNSIADSNRRLSKRLTDMVISSGLGEGDISKTECNQLNNRLKEEMREMMNLDNWSNVEGGNEEDEPYEDTLDRARSEWGELFEDDRMWSPEDSLSVARPEAVDDNPTDRSHLVMDAAADDRESLDDFLSRADSDWGWVGNLVGELDDDGTKSTPYTFNQDAWDKMIPPGDELEVAEE